MIADGLFTFHQGFCVSMDGLTYSLYHTRGTKVVNDSETQILLSQGAISTYGWPKLLVTHLTITYDTWSLVS